ncbi:MAG: hypothetical protein L6Q71_05940 [Planctomycetes bacterium]|nr:hypothetical protein [Planctomycetota bacterium]
MLKRTLGHRFPPLKTRYGESLTQYRINGSLRFFQSRLFGGLSNFWGATMLPFRERDLARWPIGTSDLIPHYSAIAQRVGIAGTTDALSTLHGHEYSNRPPLPVMSGVRELIETIHQGEACGSYRIYAGRNRAAIETRDEHINHCIGCGECMAGCFINAIYSAALTIEKWRTSRQVALVAAKVTRIDARPLRMWARVAGVTEEFGGFDRIYLCAGSVGTAEIVMRSLGIRDGVTLYDNAIFQCPVVNMRGSDIPSRDQGYVALANALLEFVAVDGETRDAHAQVYPNFDYLWRCSIPESLWPMVRPMVRWSRNRLLWVRLYTHSDEGYFYALRLDRNDELVIEEARLPLRIQQRAVLDSLRNALVGAGFFIPAIPPVLAKTSSHLAGTFPYGNGRINIERQGAILAGVHICDATCFPDSPAASPTFTIMANARRTVMESLL